MLQFLSSIMWISEPETFNFNLPSQINMKQSECLNVDNAISQHVLQKQKIAGKKNSDRYR